jgi:dCMP deaminase
MDTDVKRPNWDEYFMEMAEVAAKRSSCMRRTVGAVLVKGNHIVSTGYNGSVSGLRHCKEVGCLRDKLNIPSGQRHEICRGAHAEENTVIQAALHGTSTEGATLYTTFSPCTHCAKIIANAKIKKVICGGKYPDDLGMEILKEAGVEVTIFKKDE